MAGGFAGYLLHGSSFGAVSPYYAMNNAALQTELTAINLPLSGILSAGGSFAFGTISSSTPTSTTFTATSSALGDFVLVSTDSATSTGQVIFSGYVSSANTVTVVASVPPTAASVVVGTANVKVRVLPASTFAATVPL